MKENTFSRFEAKMYLVKNYLEFLKIQQRLEQRLLSENLVLGYINYDTIKQDCDSLSNQILNYYQYGKKENWLKNSEVFWLENTVGTLKKMWTLEEKIDMIINIDEIKNMISSHGFKVE